ncbi:MAG: pseudouridine synthase [Archangium sp.]
MVQWLDPQPARSELPERFPSPFDDVAPSPIAQRCAELVMVELRGGLIAPQVLYGDAGGKMFGVLVVRDAGGRVGFLKAVSGQVERAWVLEGFVPPAFDVALREAVEPPAEVVVKALTARSEATRKSPELLHAREALRELEVRQREERAALKLVHAGRKKLRRELRDVATGRLTPNPLHPGGEGASLDDQSRADDRERRALEARFRDEREQLLTKLKPLERHLAALDRLRPLVSREAMRRIWDSYVFTNFANEVTTLRALFPNGDPPSGAGDCAAPKLLVHAQRLGLTPIALAEFWWGAPPPAGARVEGMYFPACREKCAPILPFLTRGLDVAPKQNWKPLAHADDALPVILRDERFLVLDKPTGMLSVPARDETVTDSLLARVRASHPQAMTVHRLDLDTSGLLLVALDEDAYRLLQQQFLERTIHKQYVAVLEGLISADHGEINLPLRVDLDQRPRQLVDFEHGKPALTRWQVLSRDERRTRVAFFPVTGRTHQLRVHAAHRDGLNAPIVGDRLYGQPSARLLLHAEVLKFRHPVTDEEVTVTSPAPF